MGADVNAEGGAPALPAAARARLVAVADLLVPAGDGMPGASEVDLAGRWLDRVIAADASLVAPLVVLAGCEDWAALEALHARDPATFERGVFAIVSAYCLHPGVRKRMGYPGQRASPIRSDEPEWYLREGILEPVVARGPVYVATPDGGDGA